MAGPHDIEALRPRCQVAGCNVAEAPTRQKYEDRGGRGA
jgi:hypothetical protein